MILSKVWTERELDSSFSSVGRHWDRKVEREGLRVSSVCRYASIKWLCACVCVCVCVRVRVYVCAFGTASSWWEWVVTSLTAYPPCWLIVLFSDFPFISVHHALTDQPTAQADSFQSLSMALSSLLSSIFVHSHVIMSNKRCMCLQVQHCTSTFKAQIVMLTRVLYIAILSNNLLLAKLCPKPSSVEVFINSVDLGWTGGHL